jgi:hypothetical protein
MLGVTRQRVNQLANGDPTFPVPEAELAGGRVWTREAIEEWAVAADRVRLYVDRKEVVHYFTAAGDPQSGTVWVDTYLVATDQGLKWIGDEPGLHPTATDGMNGPSVFKVLKTRWDDLMGSGPPTK